MPDADTAAPTQDTPPDPAADGQSGEAQPNGAGRQLADVQKPAVVDVDAIAARARKKAEAERDAAIARVAELEAAEKARAEAAMTEQERREAQIAERERAAVEREAKAVEREREAVKARAIAANAPTLPVAYHAAITGETEEELAESIAAAVAAYQQDTAPAVQSVLADLAALTPEQVAEKYGDAGKAIADRLQGNPVSIGAQGNAGTNASPPEPFGPKNMTVPAWRKERERRGIGQPLNL